MGIGKSGNGGSLLRCALPTMVGEYVSVHGGSKCGTLLKASL